jgi:hypothetical protein
VLSCWQPGADKTRRLAIEKGSLLWEPAELFEAHHALDWTLKEMQRGTFRVDEASRRVLAQ